MPLTKRVEVCVRLTVVLPEPPELNVPLIELNDVKFPEPVLKKSSIKSEPILNPNGLNSAELFNACCGCVCRFLRLRSLECKSAKKKLFFFNL